MRRWLRHFRLALWGSVEHDAFSVARGAAYYSILTFFPAIMVAAAVLEAYARSPRYVDELSRFIHTALPPGTADSADSYFHSKTHLPLRVLISALGILLFSASGIVVSWMEGFLRAYRMPNTWNLAKQRLVAFLLVVASLVPMSLATVSVAFGDQIISWVMFHVAPIGPYVLIGWWLGRWIIAITTSVAVLTLVYHFGIPRWQAWYRVIPGALLATVLWSLSTELFGWYAVRYASYNLIYGPLGVGIALLVWMYIISYIVVVGAEFNAQVYPRAVLTMPQPEKTAAPATMDDEKKEQIRR